LKKILLGNTGIETPQNAFGALPIQRADMDTAIRILKRAYEGGMTFFDTARAYSDSEEKLGKAFEGMRDKIFIASKTMAHTPEEFWSQLNTSLNKLNTDYLDLYQFHCADICYRPGDRTGMYECMLEAKEQGKIRHIGITAHKLGIAEEAVESGLYETLQFPLSYLASENEIALVYKCQEAGMGYIAMKAIAGGLITNSKAAFAFISQFDHVLPIWGIQKESELEEWLGYMEEAPSMTEEMKAFIEREKKELSGDFCRGCGYCMPCPVGIQINNSARMSLMLRRAPSDHWLTPQVQEIMEKINSCLECGECSSKCPYELNTPELLKKNYEDYKKVLEGKVKVNY
jgi:uncharacterized protein